MLGSDRSGVIELGNDINVVSKNYMVELRRILDKFKIPYILDRVSFHSIASSLALAKAIHNTRILKIQKDQGVHIDNQFGHSGKFRFEHLVILDCQMFRNRIEIVSRSQLRRNFC